MIWAYTYQIVILDHEYVMSATLEMLLIATIFIIVANVPLLLPQAVENLLLPALNLQDTASH